jgi:hypothetical protein
VIDATGDLGMSLDHRAQPEQHILDRTDVASGAAAIPVEERKQPQ